MLFFVRCFFLLDTATKNLRVDTGLLKGYSATEFSQNLATE